MEYFRKLEGSSEPLFDSAADTPESKSARSRVFVPLDERTSKQDVVWAATYAVLTLVCLLVSVKLRLFAVSFSLLVSDVPVLLASFLLACLALAVFCLSVRIVTYGKQIILL